MGQKEWAADAVIAAAGQGKRVGAGRNKLLLNLGGKSILERTVEVFRTHPRIRRIWLVVSPEDREEIETLIAGMEISLVNGGVRRQDSVHCALTQLRESDPPSHVLIQDGARPFTTHDLIDRILDACLEHGAAIPGVPLADTIRRVRGGTTEVIARSELLAVQTPQGFRLDWLWGASQQAQQQEWAVTDDASLLENAGHRVHCVPGDPDNRKLTTPEDLEWARLLLAQILPESHLSRSETTLPFHA